MCLSYFFFPHPLGLVVRAGFQSMISKTIPTDHWNIQYPTKDPKSPKMQDSFQKQVGPGYVPGVCLELSLSQKHQAQIGGLMVVVLSVFQSPKPTNPRLRVYTWMSQEVSKWLVNGL